MPGSVCAWIFSTDWRMSRNFGFSVRESGVGGILVVAPIAREAFTGSSGSRERMLLLPLGWTYCICQCGDVDEDDVTSYYVGVVFKG